MTTEIYILLPVHNRVNVTRRFIECLKAQSFTNYHLILIDDGSSDGTASMVREHIPSASIIVGSGRWWWAGGLQKGLDWLTKQNIRDDAIVLFINDDVTFSESYLESAVLAMRGVTRTIFLSKFLMPDGNVLETGVCADLRKMTFVTAEVPQQINCLSTRGLFARWVDIKLIGGFRPKILPHYLSDYEYTIRAHKKGIACKTSSELLVTPDNTTTGYHSLEFTSYIDFLKKFISKKNPGNPVYWTSFVVLVSETQWIARSLLRVWAAALKSLLKAAVVSIKQCTHQ